MMPQREQPAPPGLRKGLAFRVGLTLGWALLLSYALWALHNALPLLGRIPRLSLLDFAAQAFALPSALSAPGFPLAPTLGALMLSLFVILLALTFAPLPAPTTLHSPVALDSAPAASAPPPDLASEPASPSIETLADLDPAGPSESLEPAALDVFHVAEVAEVAEVAAVEEAEAPAPAAVVAPQADLMAEVAPSASGAPDTPAARPTPPRVRQAVNSRRVFISSTSLDLHKHRQRVHDDLERMYQAPVDMAQFGAGGADATTVSYTELATAEIVVLIVAWRYGFIPDGETRSVTELEYDEARRLGLPVYVYLAAPATEADDGPDALFPAETRQPAYAAQVTAFRARLSDSNANVYDTFTSPEDLSARTVTALARRMLRMPLPSRLPTVEAQSLDRKSFKLGDDDAATFDYQIAPLQTAWDAATQALAQACAGVGGKRGIVVLGEANAGKTRLALEALMQILPDWSVLRWSEVSQPDALSDVGLLPGERLALFVDDLQNFAPFAQHGADGRMAALASNPAATLRALVGAITAESLVIVATCRSEDEQSAHAELSWLFDKLSVVRLPQFSENTEDPSAQGIIAEFAAQGATHREDWDGTLGSLVLGLSAKRAQYQVLVALRRPAVDVLRAMKLLTEAEVYGHSERRLRAVCAQVFHHVAIATDDRVWDDATEELLRLQFVRIAEETSDGTDGAITLVIRKDTYFDSDKVITDYPNPRDPSQLARHLAALQSVFVALADFEGLFYLGTMYYGRSNYGRALAAYERALALRPDHVGAWVNKGVVLGQVGRLEEALAAFDAALALRPDDAATWNNKGNALGRAGRTEEALAAFEAALALRPDHADTWWGKGIALEEAGRTEEALAAYERALALRPDVAAIWQVKGVALRKAGRLEEALAAFEEALALRPDHADTWYRKGAALGQMGRSEEALAAYERALALRPDHADTWLGKGIVLGLAGRIEEELAAYERALALRPDHADTWYIKAVALRQAGRLEEELAAFERALALRPDDAATWVNMGNALRQAGRTEEALAVYERALALRPDDADTWNNKGVALRQAGRSEEALAAYERALALRPDDAGAWNNKGYAFMALQRYDEAVAAIDQALLLEPENADWWDSRGEILLAAGRYQEALGAYERALALQPDLTPSREGKAKALRALGRDADAEPLNGGESS